LVADVGFAAWGAAGWAGFGSGGESRDTGMVGCNKAV